MSVIIRLQNLPWSANSLDIRHYFRGLSIPEGGVHIVGGEMGDAFIAFSTDEDARQAMMLGGGKIKEVQISLMLSSRSEMQKIIEAARQASMSNSLAQLLAPPTVTLGNIPQQPVIGKDPKLDKKDSSDLSSSSHETGNRRDRRDRSRSRSRDRSKRDRRDRDRDRERERDRDRDRDRRRRSRSRSRSRDRRRRRSRSRSKGRDSHTRDRERKDVKEDNRKNQDITPGAPTTDCGVALPSLDILNTTSWNVMQPGSLAQNPQLLTDFELLRNLASHKGPLIPGGPNSILGTPLGLDKSEVKPINERFTNRSNSPLLGDAPREDFVNRAKGENGRGRGFKNFDDGSFSENKFGDVRFDRNRGTKMFPNFTSGFSMRNGIDQPNNSRFGSFGRSDTGFSGSRGPGPNRDRPNPSRGLLDFPPTKPTPENRPQNTRQDRFSNRDDRVDEFGRSIQLRNRKNLSDDERELNEENKFQNNQQNFSNFGNRPGPNQANQRPPFQRGRDWQPGGRNVDGFQDRRGFRGSFVDQRFRGKGREMFGKFDDDNDIKLLEKDCCVEIRNLSPHIAYGEVRRPFSNFKLIIKEIKFFDYSSTDKKCRIRFWNSENKRKAIQVSNKIIIDHRPVHLIEINDSDFEECKDEGIRRPELRFSDDEDDVSLSPKDAYIQIKDLSLNVEEGDIAKLFPNAEIDKILLEVSTDGKSKSAYIKFQKAIDAKVALGTPNRSIGDCIVFLTPLPQYIFNDHLNKSRARSLERGDDSPEIMEVDVIKPEDEEKEKNSTNCILMKNLPLEANDRDICDFFSDIGLVPNKIHLMLDISGQSSGVAFCEFSTPSQIERACSKNSAHLGKNIVSVTQVPRSEMLDALGIGSGGGSESKLEGFGRPHCVVALENIPFKAGVLDIIKFFGWSYKLSEQDILRRYNERGQPTGDARVCFRTPEDAQRAIRFQNNRKLMERNIRMKLL